MSNEATPTERWNAACLLRAQEDHFNQNRVRWLIAVAYFAFLAAAFRLIPLDGTQVSEGVGELQNYGLVILAVVSFIFSWTMLQENWHYNAYLTYKLYCEQEFLKHTVSGCMLMAMCEASYKKVSPFHLTYTPVNASVFALSIIFGLMAIRNLVLSDEDVYLYSLIFVVIAINAAVGTWFFAAQCEPTLGSMTRKGSGLRRRDAELTPKTTGDKADPKP